LTQSPPEPLAAPGRSAGTPAAHARPPAPGPRPRSLEFGPTGLLVGLSLCVWLVIGCAEIVEGITSGEPIETVKGAVMLLVLPPILLVLRRRQRQYEAALAELGATESQLQDMAGASSDWLWEMGPNLRFTHFVGAIPRMTPEEMPGAVANEPTKPVFAATSPQPDKSRKPFKSACFVIGFVVGVTMMCSFVLGVVVPMPTLPLFVLLMLLPLVTH